MVEPYVAAQEFSVTVIQAAGGPVALLPTGINLVDPEDLVIDAQLDLDLHDAANKVHLTWEQECARLLLVHQDCGRCRALTGC